MRALIISLRERARSETKHQMLKRKSRKKALYLRARAHASTGRIKIVSSLAALDTDADGAGGRACEHASVGARQESFIIVNCAPVG